MARGDGKALKGKTKGGVLKMAAGGNLAARDAAMGGAAVGSRAEASRSTGGLGASTRDGGFGGAGGAGGGGGNEVNRGAKSDRLGPSELGSGALREYANRAIGKTFDASGDYRAPQTVNTAAKGDFSPNQVVNTAAKGDILSTQMPSYAERNKPGMASNFRTLEAAGLGAYTGNRMPGGQGATRGLGSASGSFGGFGVNEGPQTDIGDLVAGVRSNQPRGTPVSDAAEYYSSLPSRSTLEGTKPPDRVASYMGTQTNNTGPRGLPSSGPYGGQTVRAEAGVQGGQAAPATPKPSTENKPASAGPQKATRKDGSVFTKDGVRYQIRDGKAYNFNVPGGSKRGKSERDDRERGGNKKDGGVVRKADGAATRGKTRGRYL